MIWHGEMEIFGCKIDFCGKNWTPDEARKSIFCNWQTFSMQISFFTSPIFAIMQISGTSCICKTLQNFCIQNIASDFGKNVVECHQSCVAKNKQQLNFWLDCPLRLEWKTRLFTWNVELNPSLDGSEGFWNSEQVTQLYKINIINPNSA